MPKTLEINNDLFNALVETFGEEAVKERVDSLLLSAIESLIRKYSQDILAFEEKYALPFKEFEQLWDQDKIKDKHSHEVESDFMDWETLEMEKRDLLALLSKLKGALKNDAR